MLLDPRRWRSRTTDEIPWWHLPMAVALCVVALALMVGAVWLIWQGMLYIIFS
jgi:hypothetical protein